MNNLPHPTKPIGFKLRKPFVPWRLGERVQGFSELCSTLCATQLSLIWAIMFSMLALLGIASSAKAHGTEIDLNEVAAIEVHARFDSGEPMSNAQVSVYAPTDRANPWLQGLADENGHFVFVPDRAIPGQWDVQLRTAGHGDWVYIDVAEGQIAGLKSSSGGLTAAQIAMMSAAVIWGFVGTALYFIRPKETG